MCQHCVMKSGKTCHMSAVCVMKSGKMSYVQMSYAKFVMKSGKT